jgi:hypothetical protein
VDVDIVAEAIANLELPIELTRDLTFDSDVATESPLEIAHLPNTKLPSDLLLSQRCSRVAGKECWMAGEGAPDLRPLRAEEQNRVAPATPVFNPVKEVEDRRHAHSNSVLGMAVIFVGVVSAFVLGAVGCLLVLEHLPG